MAPRTKAKSGKAGAKDANPKQPLIKSKLYSHVHVSKSTDRWDAWVREPKRRGDLVFLGTHLTERLAARCQDRALLKLKTEPTMTRPIKLNFPRADYAEDKELRRNTTLAGFIKQLQKESRARYLYKELEPTLSSCLLKFIAEEVALGNIPSNSTSNIANSENKLADAEIDETSDYKETDEEEPEEDENDSGDEDEPEDPPTDMVIAFQDTANAAEVAANASAEPLDCGEAADSRESGEVLGLPERNRRPSCGLPTEDELEVAAFLVTEAFRSRWASGSASEDVLDAASTIVQMRRDPNYIAPVQNESRPKRNQTRPVRYSS